MGRIMAKYISFKEVADKYEKVQAKLQDKSEDSQFLNIQATEFLRLAQKQQSLLQSAYDFMLERSEEGEGLDPDEWDLLESIEDSGFVE